MTRIEVSLFIAHNLSTFRSEKKQILQVGVEEEDGDGKREEDRMLANRTTIKNDAQTHKHTVGNKIRMNEPTVRICKETWHVKR